MSGGEFSKGWKPLFSGVIGVATGASPIPFNVLPIVLGPIHYAMGWSFLEISIGITIYGILGALLAPAVGALADKFGVKPVAMLSLLGFGLAFSLLYFTPSNILGFYAMWALIGIVGIGSTPVTWSRTINLWFVKHKGLALGILLLGTSIAGLIVPQIANAVIEVSNWRYVFPVMAMLPLFIGLPLAFFLFRDPKPEERPASIRDASGELVGLQLGEVFRGYRFWVLFFSVVAIALAYGGAHIHMAQMVQLHGFTAGQAAGVMGVVASGIFAGRVIVGLLFDRFWAPAVAFPVLLLPVVACWLLLGTATSAPLIYTAAFMLGGCAGMSRQEVSTVTGAAVGAVAGAAVGGPIATVGGAVVSGVVGNEVGKK